MKCSTECIENKCRLLYSMNVNYLAMVCSYKYLVFNTIWKLLLKLSFNNNQLSLFVELTYEAVRGDQYPPAGR